MTTSNNFDDIIRNSCKSIGINDLDKNIMAYLNKEIEQKIKIVLNQSKTFMRTAKRKTLTTGDLSNSIRSLNLKEFYTLPSFDCDEKEIDIDAFANSPLVPCPMKPIAHFHWFCIQGQIPNICSNIINKDKITPLNSDNNNEYLQQGNSKVVPKLQKSLSKELVTFLENFEEIFQTNIKDNLMTESIYPRISNEMEINIIIIQSEPGIVQLFPYLISYVLNEAEDEKNVSQPKIQMILLYHIRAILTNKYFYLDPYLSQFIRFLLYFLLVETPSCSSSSIASLIGVKNLSLECLKIINENFSSKYSSMTEYIIQILSSNVIPNKKNPMYLTSYGAIRGLNALGSEYVKDIILPHLEDILSTLDMKEVLEAQDKKVKLTSQVNNTIQPTPNQNNIINNTNENNISGSNNSGQLGGNVRMSFTLPLTAGMDPVVYASLFSTGQSQQNNNTIIHESAVTNVIEQNQNTINTVKEEMIIDNNAIDKVWNYINCKSTCVYYSLIESAFILYDKFNSNKDIMDKIYEIYGEKILNNFQHDNMELDMVL